MLCLVVFRPSSSPLGSPSLSESAKQSCSVNLWPFLWKSWKEIYQHIPSVRKLQYMYFVQACYFRKLKESFGRYVEYYEIMAFFFN